MNFGFLKKQNISRRQLRYFLGSQHMVRNRKSMHSNSTGAVENNRNNLRTICEGSSEIEIAEKVFYNPVQEFNRDLSIAVLNEFARTRSDSPLVVFEAFSATGLRSIRYAKEVENITKVIANDLSRKAVDLIERNIAKNNVTHLVDANNQNAIEVMQGKAAAVDLTGRNRFDAIDLDPYGCPTRFLDGAVQAVNNGGLLLVTATDMAVLAGNSPESCFAKYGSVSLKIRACHEMALRILLQTIQMHANRYGRYIEPLVSISADFYIRVFVRVHTSPVKCKLTLSNSSLVYLCNSCQSHYLQPMGFVKEEKTNLKYSLAAVQVHGPNCPICGHHWKIGGPIWSGPLYNQEFIMRLLNNFDRYEKLKTWPRILGMLTMMSEELSTVPLYYEIRSFCNVLKISSPKLIRITSALLNANYAVSLTHCCSGAVKTDAPIEFVWAVFCQLATEQNIKYDDGENAGNETQKYYIGGKVYRNIRARENLAPVDFTPRLEANPDSRRRGLCRFQMNPMPNWGPGTRSMPMIKSRVNDEPPENKRVRLQAAKSD